MVMDLNGSELSVALVVRFWCVPEATFIRGYVSSISETGKQAHVVALEPGRVQGDAFLVWTADCEILKGSSGRPLHFRNGQEVEDGEGDEDGDEAHGEVAGA